MAATGGTSGSREEDATSPSSSSSRHHLDEAATALSGLVCRVENLDGGTVVGELLRTADVLFCTLSTAGSSLMKGTARVDDMLVDEAAAATEPEVCVPFHLRPKRLLAVGDPKQVSRSVGRDSGSQ